MKPQVPDILAKFYKKNDTAIHIHEIKKEDLPEIGCLYRDNTSGIIWEVFAHTGGDTYKRTPAAYEYDGSLNDFSKKAYEKERLVILKAVDPEAEGVFMHLDPSLFKAKIHSGEHYAVIVKADPEIKRFEEVDGLESSEIPFWKRGVKTLSAEKVMKKLNNPDTTSLYVLNVYPTPHGLVDLLFEYVDETSPNKNPVVDKIEATWLPQDILKRIPKSVLINSPTFLRYLNGGFIQPITNGSAKLIMETPEAENELERISGKKPNFERYMNG